MVELQRVKALRDSRINIVSEFLHNHHVAPQLSAEVRAHLSYETSLDSVERQTEDCLRSLPKRMRNGILMAARGPMFSVHGFFMTCQSMSSRFMERLLCEKTSNHIYQADELIFSTKETATEAYIMHQGGVVYIPQQQKWTLINSNNSEVEVLQSIQRQTRQASQHTTSHRIPIGQFVSEICLWCQWRHSGNLRTETRASLLVLKVGEFTHLVKSYPSIFSLAGFFANEFATACRRAPDRVTDMFDFHQMHEVLSTTPPGPNRSFSSEALWEPPLDAEWGDEFEGPTFSF